MPELTQYTITVAGVERLDGEAPYVYVVHAPNQHWAESIALVEHDRYEREDTGIEFHGDGDYAYSGPKLVDAYEESPPPKWGIKATLTYRTVVNYDGAYGLDYDVTPGS